MGKRIATVCGIFLIAIILCTCGISRKEFNYIPTGEFYAKTRPCVGDAGVSSVISLEADYASYECDGDLVVSMTVGFGHHAGVRGYGEDVKDTFYVRYWISDEAEDYGDEGFLWEKIVEYEDSWYDAKYNTTEQVNHPFLFIPHYGEFFPLFTEQVELVFPADIARGYLHVEMVSVVEGEEHDHGPILDIRFQRVDGVLTLEQYD